VTPPMLAEMVRLAIAHPCASAHQPTPSSGMLFSYVGGENSI
jgi:hypothetical protein